MDVVGVKVDGVVVVLVVVGGGEVGVGGVGGGRGGPSRHVLTQPSKQQNPLLGQSEGEQCQVEIFLSSSRALPASVRPRLQQVETVPAQSSGSRARVGGHSPASSSSSSSPPPS